MLVPTKTFTETEDMRMTEEKVGAFVDSWIAAWNRRDLAAVLTHYATDVRFFSPIAAEVAGAAAIEGKEALAAYWRDALEKFDRLEFTPETFTWDPVQKLLTIHYVARLNGTPRMVCEAQWFGADGKVTRAAAYYGAVL